jgi:single stranded DNA-binding protein
VGREATPLIVYTNYTVRNADGSKGRESERHAVALWGRHAEKAARLLKKGSMIRIQGHMTYPSWTDRKTGETRYGAEIVAATLDYQGATESFEEAPQSEQPVELPAPQPAEPVPTTEEPTSAKPRRSRSKNAQAAA